MRPVLPALVGVVASLAMAMSALGAQTASPYAAWKHGPPSDPDWFMIGVWLQDPRLAERYRDLGVNTFVGLWQGPTQEQLTTLRDAGMRVVCDQNRVSLAWRGEPTIIAWRQGGEPDNREKGGKEAKPQASPEEVQAVYAELKAADPDRPVMLGLGQGVANDAFKGRGASPADYPRYAQACDILAFDIYPVTNIQKEDGENYLWLVAKGLKRLREWGGPDKVLWNAIECTKVTHETKKPTPAQVEAEVWMSIVHGSRGITYFCHEFKPETKPAALLDDREMCEALKQLNERVLRLAPVLNDLTVENAVEVESSKREVEVAVLAKQHEGALYVFAIGMRNAPTEAVFRLRPSTLDERIEVLDEERTVPLQDGEFKDSFGPYAMHLYRLHPEH